MKEYRSHNIITAFKIAKIKTGLPDEPFELVLSDEDGTRTGVSSTYAGLNQPRVGGYFIRHPDGREDYLPEKIFEGAHTEASADDVSNAKARAKGEPTFSLRAQDKVAPEVVGYWMESANAIGASLEKQNSAGEIAEAMHAWQVQHGCKVPD